jgi:hypothetical protein
MSPTVYAEQVTQVQNIRRRTTVVFIAFTLGARLFKIKQVSICSWVWIFSLLHEAEKQFVGRHVIFG